MNPQDAQKDTLWWKHGVLYQIYPRSFFDSDGDGVGDLTGLVQRLDYLQDLGISGIWLSPIFPSPMKDFGYDISDYRGIDKVFGNLSDLRILVDQAHSRGIRVILDMVFNHSSDRHPWFLESRRSPEDPKRDWYLWHPGKKRGHRRPAAPNNWRGAFGGRAWTWDEETQEYYLHLFLKEQPDLNWRNPEVRAALFDVLRHWMELGVDGFRFDVINFIVKDAEFRSNPYRFHRDLPRRFEQQNHLFDRTRPESHTFLKELREVLDEYPERMSVGEIFPNEGVIDHRAVASYIGDGTDELHLAFDFSLNYVRFRAAEFSRSVEGQYKALPEKGWPVHVLSNHDQSRAMTRLAHGSPEKMKLLLTFLLTQRGTPFLYYGDEIGMDDVRVPRDRMQDPVGIRYWPLHPGRDRARTPMQWAEGPGAGFSPADPWLPVPLKVRNANVQSQKGKPGSILEHTRQLIRLRKERRELSHGDWKLLDSCRSVLAYSRSESGRTLVILLNFSGRKKRWTAGGTAVSGDSTAGFSLEGASVLSDSCFPTGGGAFIRENPLILRPFQALVLEI